MSEQTSFNVIVVGSGLGGLTAGATLSRFGKKVLVLEQHYVAGGCATNFKRKEIMMEVGLHEMNGLYEGDIKVKIFDLLEVNKNIWFVPVPELFHIVSSNYSFTFPHGSAIAEGALIEKYPHEEKGIRAFFKLMTDIMHEVNRIPAERWKLLMIYPLVPLLFPNVFRSLKTTCGAWLDKNIEDEEVKLILTTNMLYYGDDPYDHSLMHFAIAQANYVHGGGFYVKGGSQKLSSHLASYIEKNGGQVLLGKKVDKILMNNGKVNGVQYSDAFNDQPDPVKIYADAVIANAAIPLIAEMLPSPFNQKLKAKINRLQTACSLISIYMAFDVDLKKFGVKHYSTFFEGEGVQSLKDIKSNNQGDWNKRCFVFVDYSQIDSGIAPDGQTFGVICAANYLSDWEGLDETAYKVKKDLIAQMFFRRLDNHYPGITNHIVYYEVGTAKTIERYTKNPNGTPYGYAQSPSQSGLSRIPAKSDIKNLYFASAWSFPGGGFTGTITGGYSAALSANRSVEWKKHNGQLLKDNRIVKLVDKKLIANNTLELTFEKPQGFIHKAGQYAVVSLNDARIAEIDLPFRSLSIVSHPDENVLRFAMRISKSGFKQACTSMQLGEEATIYGPCGNFAVKPGTKNIAFLVSGIGITPVISMLKEIEKNRFEGKVCLFYSNNTPETTAYHNDLRDLSIRSYVYKPVMTSYEKRIDIEFLKDSLSVTDDYHYYIVGTSGFLASMRQLLLEEQVSIENIKFDDFG